jgi:hypothetical protein
MLICKIIAFFNLRLIFACDDVIFFCPCPTLVIAVALSAAGSSFLSERERASRVVFLTFPEWAGRSGKLNYNQPLFSQIHLLLQGISDERIFIT